MSAETETHIGGHGEGGEGRSIGDMMGADSWRKVGYINGAYWIRYVDKISIERR